MRRLLIAVALLTLAPIAQAQDDPRLAAVAETYGASRWPAPGPRRAGVDPSRLEAKGWKPTALRVDPRVAEGRLTLATEGGDEATVTLRLFDQPKAARAALLARLSGAQRTLAPEAAGEVAFGGRDPQGRLFLLAGVRGNVLFELRALRHGEAGLEALAGAVDGLIASARPLEPGVPLPAPRVLTVQVPPARAGEPVRLTLDVDPAGPQPAHVAFTCSGDAGVLEVEGGWELLAPQAGPVTIQVWACSKELLVTRTEVTLEVGR